jgi:hypothetical protein
MHLHSIAAYADQIVDEIDESSIQCLRGMTIHELPTLHHSWGMAIRNEFGLWSADHPLTKHWHQKPEERDLRSFDGFTIQNCEGVDYSKDHPDAISMEIMRAVWKKVNA